MAQAGADGGSPEDKALLEQILLESSACNNGSGAAGFKESSGAPAAALGAGPAAEHGCAVDFSADDAAAGKQGSASAAAAVGGAVVARLKDLKLGERLGSMGDRVLTNFNPGRVLAETVEVPVGILGWQLRFPSGWGPYLCLPLQEGTYTRLELAATVQSLLQSTVGTQEHFAWKVVVLARQRRLCFRLVVPASSTVAPSERVCGFRLAPSTELCLSLGCVLGADGWLTSEIDVDGSFCAGHQTLASLPFDMLPAARGSKEDAGAAAGGGGGGGGGPTGEGRPARTAVPPPPPPNVAGDGGRGESASGGWKGWVGRHLEVASSELSDIGMAARQSGASILKLMQHPIASFAVPLVVVVRREMEVVVSCGGMRQERPPIVLENMLCALDSIWGASRAGGLLLQQQPRPGPKSSILDTVLAFHGVPPHQPPAEQGEEWHEQKHALIRLLDDSPGAPDLARVRDASLLWAVLREYVHQLPEPLVPWDAYAAVIDGVRRFRSARAPEAGARADTAAFDAHVHAGEMDEHAQASQRLLRCLHRPLQGMAATQAAHLVSLRRLLVFLHRHIFLLPMRSASGALPSQDDAATRELVLQRVSLSLALAVLRPSNQVNAAVAACMDASLAAQELIRHAAVLFP